MEQNLILRYQDLKATEEATFKQKSRISWLASGDQNTGFFYEVTTARRSFNAIKLLISSEGAKLTAEQDIRVEAENFYLKLLGTVDYQAQEASVFRSATDQESGQVPALMLSVQSDRQIGLSLGDLFALSVPAPKPDFAIHHSIE